MILATVFDMLEWNYLTLNQQFIPQLKEMLKSHKVLKEDNHLGNHLFIAQNDQLFDIDSFFAVDDFSEIAMTYQVEALTLSIINQSSKIETTDLIRNIFKAHAAFLNETFLPFSMISTSDLEYKIIEA
jgi:hypothetical protein